MGLCTSKSTVTLDPSAHTPSADPGSQAAGQGVSPDGTPILEEGILMVQPVKSKAESGGGGGWIKTSSAVNQTAKGYLELGGKGAQEVEAQTSREAEEEEELGERDEVEELINFSESEGSLRSEFLEVNSAIDCTHITFTASLGPSEVNNQKTFHSLRIQSTSANNKNGSLTRNNCKMHEFNTNLENLGKAVKNCSENCSSVQTTTDKICRCLNLSMPQGERVFPGYFIKGLKSLQPTPDFDQTIRGLVKILNRTLKGFNDTVFLLEVDYEFVISPKSLWKKLNFVAKQINSICAQTLDSNQ